MKPLSTIEIRRTDSTETVQAEILPGGLFALLRHYGQWKWMVTHIPTGINAGGFGNKSKARKYGMGIPAESRKYARFPGLRGGRKTI